MFSVPTYRELHSFYEEVESSYNALAEQEGLQEASIERDWEKSDICLYWESGELDRHIFTTAIEDVQRPHLYLIASRQVAPDTVKTKETELGFFRLENLDPNLDFAYTLLEQYGADDLEEDMI